MKFPYGITDFKEIVTGDYFYCDRTDKIPLLEQAQSQIFIRPRQFGKTLLLSMLEHYYDVGRKNEFEEIFGNLAIGKRPTEHRNSCFILRWDLSFIETRGTTEDFRKSLVDHVNDSIRTFYNRYSESFELPETRIYQDDALSSISSLGHSVQKTNIPICLLIDEYDSFANDIMLQAEGRQKQHDAFLQREDIIKTLFKAVKASTSSTMFDRVFITGVAPLVLSDDTSGYNVAEHVYFSRSFNDLCGFRESEVREALEQLTSECDCRPALAEKASMRVRTDFDGYRFCLNNAENVYNPMMCLYFFKLFQDTREFPATMFEDNLSRDHSTLEYISRLPQGKNIVMQLSQKGQQITVDTINDRFSLQDMLRDETKDTTFLASYLYYLGILTIGGINDMGKIVLQVPNQAIQRLYVDRVHRMLLGDPGTKNSDSREDEQINTA